jgi:hypothetical protein
MKHCKWLQCNRTVKSSVKCHRIHKELLRLTNLCIFRRLLLVSHLWRQSHLLQDKLYSPSSLTTLSDRKRHGEWNPWMYLSTVQCGNPSSETNGTAVSVYYVTSPRQPYPHFVCRVSRHNEIVRSAGGCVCFVPRRLALLVLPILIKAHCTIFLFAAKTVLFPSLHCTQMCCWQTLKTPM